MLAQRILNGTVAGQSAFNYDTTGVTEHSVDLYGRSLLVSAFASAPITLGNAFEFPTTVLAASNFSTSLTIQLMQLTTQINPYAWSPAS